MTLKSTTILVSAFFIALICDAYVTTTLNVGLRPPHDHFKLIPLPKGKSSKWIRKTWPRLDNQWRKFHFSFIPERDGMALFNLRVGSGEPEVPFYFRNIKIDDSPLCADNKWVFKAWPRSKGKVASLNPANNDELRVYYGSSVEYDIPLTKGEKVEITFEGKSGSVLTLYTDKLEKISSELAIATELAPTREDKNLAKALEEFASLAHQRLEINCTSLNGERIGALLKFTRTLEKSLRAKRNRTFLNQTPCLFNHPKERNELRHKLSQIKKLASQLKKKCLLSYMIPDQP